MQLRHTRKNPIKTSPEKEKRKVPLNRGKQITKNPSGNKKNTDEAENRSELEESKKLLHTYTLPDILLNREKECEEIRRFIVNGIKPHSETKSRVLYISGVPGTGKTASVLKVTKDLLKAPRTTKFNFANINGLELSDPKDLYAMVYRRVNTGLVGARKKISAKNAQQFLNEYFENSTNKRKKPIVILVDEVDMLYTKREEIVYTLFNWASLEHSRCCIIAISNTLDLAERKFSQRIVSRMGSNKLVFQPYTFEEIHSILRHRIKNCKAINDKTIELTSKKIASISGDLRKAFELMRRSIDIAIEQGETEGIATNCVKLLPEHVLEAIRESTTSIRMEFVKTLSKHEELLFRSLVMDLYESALEETDFSKVLLRYKKICTPEAMIPLSLSAAFHHMEEMAHSHLVLISPENGMLHCRVKLGFPISEAQFCIRQLDSHKNNPHSSTPFNSASKSFTKSPTPRAIKSPTRPSTSTNSVSTRPKRKINFEPEN